MQADSDGSLQLGTRLALITERLAADDVEAAMTSLAELARACEEFTGRLSQSDIAAARVAFDACQQAAALRRAHIESELASAARTRTAGRVYSNLAHTVQSR